MQQGETIHFSRDQRFGDRPPKNEVIKSACIFVVCLLITLPTVIRDYKVATGNEWIIAGVIAALSIVTAMGQISIDLRRRPMTMTLGDFPLAIALLTLPLHLIIITRLIGVLAVVLAQRKGVGRGLSNAGVYTLEAALAIQILDWMNAGTVWQPITWLALVIAVVSTCVVGTAAIAASIAWVHEERLSVFPKQVMALSSTIGACCTIAACVCVAGCLASPWAVPLVGMLLALITFTFRVNHELQMRSSAFSSFRSLISQVRVSDEDILEAFLAQACHLTQSEQGRAYICPADKAPEPFVYPRNSRDPVGQSWLSQHRSRDAIRITVPRGDDTVTVVEIMDKRPEIGTFNQNDKNLLEVLSSHAESAWRNRHLRRQVRQEASRDAVTGVGNRQLVMSVLDETKSKGVLAVFGSPSITRITAGFGVEVSDGILEVAAKHLESTVGHIHDATIARIGDALFGVWLPGLEEDKLSEIFSKAQAKLSFPPASVNNPFYCGYVVRAGSIDSSTLLHQAHSAYMMARTSDAKLPRPFNVADVERARERLDLSEDLRVALTQGMLSVAYQPVVCAATGRLLSCEALSRWQHPVHGKVSPDDFISLAEQTDQIGSLTRQVLTQATLDCASWQGVAPGVGVAINVSASDIKDATFAGQVSYAVQAAGLPPGLVTIEVTETGLVTDSRAAFEHLQALREWGIHVSVDDFGTGYSSLGYLRSLPIDQVKIDKSFVMDLDENKSAGVLLSEMIKLLQSLDLQLVAEGVETGSIADFLSQAGCNRLQGYGISRPLDLPSLRQWYSNYPIDYAFGLERKQTAAATGEAPKPIAPISHITTQLATK